MKIFGRLDCNSGSHFKDMPLLLLPYIIQQNPGKISLAGLTFCDGTVVGHCFPNQPLNTGSLGVVLFSTSILNVFHD